MGTGVLLGGRGAFVTAHYVAIGARAVRATWPDGSTAEGRVAAIDYASGLAVVEVEGPLPRVLPMRPNPDVMPGEDCFVVASTGAGREVRSGMVTAVGPFEAFWEYRVERGILASAEMPGLGGGPLVDVRGRVMGIASLSLAEIGRATFAVPTSLAVGLVDAVAVGAPPLPGPRRAWLGLTCYPIGENLVIAGVIPESPSARAGLAPGDVVDAIDGRPVHDRASLFEAIWRHASGDRILLAVSRDQRSLEIDVTSGSIEAFFATET